MASRILALLSYHLVKPELQVKLCRLHQALATNSPLPGPVALNNPLANCINVVQQLDQALIKFKLAKVLAKLRLLYLVCDRLAETSAARKAWALAPTAARVMTGYATSTKSLCRSPFCQGTSRFGGTEASLCHSAGWPCRPCCPAPRSGPDRHTAQRT